MSTHKLSKHAVGEADVARPGATLSTAGLVFMIIAASAPLTVLAGGAPTSYAVSGLLGIPLGYVAIGLVLILFSVGYARMSSEIQNSGAFYVYISHGLGLRQGIAAAILALVSYNLMQIGLYGLFGFTSQIALLELTGIDLPWWVMGGIGWVVVAVLGVNNIDFSAKVLGVIVALEFLVVGAFAVAGLIVAPEGITTHGWRASEFLTPGVGVLLAFTMAAFMGFESGAIYSEETRDPERTVARATYIAVSIVALFYAFSSWALQVAVGHSSIVENAQQLGPDLVFDWIGRYSPALALVTNLLFITSLIAALIAFHNAAARYFFSTGRAGVLPAAFSRINKAQAPVVGSACQSVLSAVVVAIFALAGRGSELGELFPVMTLFTWFTNAAALGLTFLVGVTSFAVCGWARRVHPEWGAFPRVVAPVLAGVGMFAVTALILVNFNLMVDSENPVVVWVMPAVIVGSGVIGLIWGALLMRTGDLGRLMPKDML
ncbi:APC family permease [Corynebacterium mayonis]|uniref:APC family permease n=1 Tax=Corynebacterium mayonis TaxID=3062461 RepID=UPI0031406A22